MKHLLLSFMAMVSICAEGHAQTPDDNFTISESTLYIQNVSGERQEKCGGGTCEKQFYHSHVRIKEYNKVTLETREIVIPLVAHMRFVGANFKAGIDGGGMNIWLERGRPLSDILGRYVGGGGFFIYQGIGGFVLNKEGPADYPQIWDYRLGLGFGIQGAKVWLRLDLKDGTKYELQGPFIKSPGDQYRKISFEQALNYIVK